MLYNTNEIVINNETAFTYIQKVFNRTYPYLNIEFTVGKKKTQYSRHKNILTNYQVKDFTVIKGPVAINIAPNRTIKQVEQDFIQLAGLHIEVFRKSGNVWSGISFTGNWTLQVQNMAGQSIYDEIGLYE